VIIVIFSSCYCKYLRHGQGSSQFQVKWRRTISWLRFNVVFDCISDATSFKFLKWRANIFIMWQLSIPLDTTTLNLDHEMSPP
jgi:hypothetical protein